MTLVSTTTPKLRTRGQIPKLHRILRYTKDCRFLASSDNARLLHTDPHIVPTKAIYFLPP